MENCIFCKIIENQIPSTKIYEDDNFLAFMDINPVVKGHILLIPKKHFEWMHDTDDEILSDIFITAKKIMVKMKESLPCDYVQVSIVGEEVLHFHIHLIPRYHNDGLSNWPKVSYESADEMKDFASKISFI